MKKLIFFIILLFAQGGFAQNYYVKSNGDDGDAGTSDAVAWRTIAKVNSFSFQPGDKVYFKCGDTWIGERLVIDWSGSLSDSGTTTATTASKLVDSSQNFSTTVSVGDTVFCVRDSYSIGTATVTNIDSNTTLSIDSDIMQSGDDYRIANFATAGSYYGSGTIGVSGDEPVIDGTGLSFADQWVALVQANNLYYINIENLDITNSYGQGLGFTESLYCLAQNLTVSESGNAGIQFTTSQGNYGDGAFGIIDSCDVSRSGVGHTIAGGSFPLWPLAVGANYADSLTVRNCTIYNTFTEGIGFYKGANYGIAEYNLIYNARQVGIYVDAGKHNIIRHNRIYGTTDTTYHRGSGTPGWGIAVADEGLVGFLSENNSIFDNFVAFHSSGVHIGVSLGGAEFKDSEVYNNTLVGNTTGISISGDSFSNSFIRNNIIWAAGGTALYSGRSTTSGLTWSHNNWSTAVSGDASGTGDVIGNPSLSKTSGWRSLTAGSLSDSDFALQSDSPCINTGITITGYENIIDAEQTTLPGTVVLLDQGDHGLSEIGADIYTGGAVPSGVLVPTGWADENDLAAGGDIIIDLQNDHLVATFGDNNAITTAFIAAMDGNLSCTTCWDTEVLTNIDYTNVARTSSTRITVTVPSSNYDINQTETISITIPASSVEGGNAIQVTPSIIIGVSNPDDTSQTPNYDGDGHRFKYLSTGHSVRHN